MSDTHCDECGTAFYGHGDHRGNYWLTQKYEDRPDEVIGRFCSKQCLATFANRRAADSDTP